VWRGLGHSPCTALHSAAQRSPLYQLATVYRAPYAPAPDFSQWHRGPCGGLISLLRSIAPGAPHLVMRRASWFMGSASFSVRGATLYHFWVIAWSIPFKEASKAGMVIED